MAFAFDLQEDFQIGLGNVRKGFFCPLHDTSAIAAKVFFQSCFQKFIRMSESIKIKVIQRNSRNCINFDQGVSRAFNAAGVPQTAQQAARERGFSRSQVAGEPDDQPRYERWRKACTEILGGLGISKIHKVCAGTIIGGVMQHTTHSSFDAATLVKQIREWGRELGFSAVGIAGIELASAEQGLLDWLTAGFHGGMDYMARHGLKRARPAELVPGTASVIAVRMDYWPEPDLSEARSVQANGLRAAVSRYALGRDYHKVLRNRLQQLAERIGVAVGAYGYRVFVDSAPVLEAALATRAGLGWRGKHTLLLNREAGSLFFLGEIYVDLTLPTDVEGAGHCGNCSACLPACPTQAIVAPYKLDARRCISYLTIEHADSIPLEFRHLIGNRVYGCDDCQLVCPWNRFARPTQEPDFAVRNGLDRATLVELFAWTEEEFKTRLAGSAIYRIGHERWLRNLAVGLGNAPGTAEVIAALQARAEDASALVREHVAWALAQHAVKQPENR
ncbi:MAG: queG [Proteobacteria bacterium]|nr:queG [Pseudomonadota bacterium]